MATTNPSIARAFRQTQDCFTITTPLADLYQNAIAGVSKADPAIVSLGASTTVISTTGTVGTIAGSGPWTATITGMTTTEGLVTGQFITATAGTGTIGTGVVQVVSIVGNKSITIKAVGGLTPGAGTVTNISIQNPSKIPVGLVDGDAILINDVAGMTELATAGVDGTSKFFVSVTGVTTLGLYTDAELTTSVDSSGFSTATANTGYFETFGVTEYNQIGRVTTVAFNESGPVVGSDISIDTDTGVISLLTGDLAYTLTATAEINMAGATYQWYNVTNSPVITALGTNAPVGSTLTLVYTPADPEDVALIVTAPNGSRFEYPTQITNAQAVIDVASGFVA